MCHSPHIYPYYDIFIHLYILRYSFVFLMCLGCGKHLEYLFSERHMCILVSSVITIPNIFHEHLRQATVIIKIALVLYIILASWLG